MSKSKIVTSGRMTHNEYAAVHKWVNRVLGRPQQCAVCDTTDGLIEWANISGEYKREVDDWKRLCRSCHRKLDAPTVCPHGHQYTPENTYVGNDGGRDCRTCHRVRQNKRNALKRLEAHPKAHTSKGGLG